MMSQFGQDMGSGFGSFFTRFFSLFTIAAAFVVADDPSIASDIPIDYLVPALFILGMHGLFTKSDEVGIIRKFLCYMSGVPGAVFAFNLLGQWIGM